MSAQKDRKDRSRPDLGNRFRPGVSGNKFGRPKLTPELSEMRTAALSKAVAILHARIHDARYMAKLRPLELVAFLSMAFDRAGLPRVTRSELAGTDGEALTVQIISYGTKSNPQECR